MDSTIRNNIKIGQTVKVIQKQDQRTGKQTEGVVERILTNSANHPRGIKVKLEVVLSEEFVKLKDNKFDIRGIFMQPVLTMI